MVSCSQCQQQIGGHDPKCVIEGGWWCGSCVYGLEMQAEAEHRRERELAELERLMAEEWNA